MAFKQSFVSSHPTRALRESVAAVEMPLVSAERKNEERELKNAMLGAGGIEFMFEQEIMAIRQEIDGLFTRLSPMGNSSVHDRDMLVQVDLSNNGQI